jgi:hypothetical protein
MINTPRPIVLLPLIAPMSGARRMAERQRCGSSANQVVFDDNTLDTGFAGSMECTNASQA